MSATVEYGSRLTHGPDVLAFAEEVGESDAVAVAGGRTRWSCGGASTGQPRLLAAPVGVVAYTPDEMTVRVGCGTTVAHLDSVLAEQGQRCALPDRGGTIGGAIAVGENHRDSMGRGAIRTAVLQTTYVSAEGRVVSGGGPTVKNVSGFDMPRLMVGSLGTLGCLAEVILRTNPIPAESRWLQTGADPFDVFDALLAPSAILWDGETTWVHIEGHGADVDAESARVGDLGSTEPVDGPPAKPGDQRWSVPPADLRRAQQLCDGPFLASVGVGTIWTAQPQPARDLSPAVTEIHDRMKLLFDPYGRLNPGRHPANR